MLHNSNLHFISMILGMVNELFQTKNDESIAIARKYLNMLQDNGCKIRLIDGSIVLVDYKPMRISRL